MHFFLFVCGGAVFGLIFQFLSDPFASPLEHLRTFGRQSAPMLVVLLCLIPVFVRDTVKRMGNGEDVPPLKFRKNDLWEDLPELFNSMVTRLKEYDSSPLTVCEQSEDKVSQESQELISI